MLTESRLFLTKLGRDQQKYVHTLQVAVKQTEVPSTTHISEPEIRYFRLTNDSSTHRTGRPCWGLSDRHGRILGHSATDRSSNDAPRQVLWSNLALIPAWWMSTGYEADLESPLPEVDDRHCQVWCEQVRWCTGGEGEGVLTIFVLFRPGDVHFSQDDCHSPISQPCNRPIGQKGR